MYRYLITLALLLIASPISFMSVYGFVTAFSGWQWAFYPLLCLGSGMEYGKLFLVVQLHRRRKTIKWSKIIYGATILVLTLITTLELSGFLVQSYTYKAEKIIHHDIDIHSLKNEKTLIVQQMKKIDDSFKGLPDTWQKVRSRTRKESGYYEKEKRLFEIERLLGKSEKNSLSNKVREGPIFTVSRLANMKDDRAISIFLVLVILALEPLSLGLTVAVSDAWEKKEFSIGQKIPEKKEEKTHDLTLIQEKDKMDYSSVEPIEISKQDIPRPMQKKAKLYSSTTGDEKIFK